MNCPPITFGDRIRGLALLLTLVLSWGAIPASLVFGEADGCGMAHCEEEGECCCIVNPAGFGEDQDSPRFFSSRLITPCPRECCKLVSSYRLSDIDPGEGQIASEPDSGESSAAIPAGLLIIQSLSGSPAEPRGPPYFWSIQSAE
ncbi:MAG: hypothetical protein IPM66_01330 [Acidobacteriota bacterium]|nr:MAG: hypothetical protein IPM66_01330 [Acidobacteriota bacterium]